MNNIPSIPGHANVTRCRGKVRSWLIGMVAAGILILILFLITNQATLPSVPIPTLNGDVSFHTSALPLAANATIERDGKTIHIIDENGTVIPKDWLMENHYILVSVSDSFKLTGPIHPYDLLLGKDHFLTCEGNPKRTNDFWFYVYKSDRSESTTGFEKSRFGISPCAAWKGMFPNYPSRIEDMVQIQKGDLLFIALAPEEHDRFTQRNEEARIAYSAPVFGLNVVTLNFDADGTELRDGVFDAATFRFGFSPEETSPSLKAELRDILFVVKSANVEMAADHFVLFNKHVDSGIRSRCMPLRDGVTFDTGVVMGTFLVECREVPASGVPAVVPANGSQEFVFQVEILNQQIHSRLESGLQVSMDQFTDASRTAFGHNQSHVHWRGSEDGTQGIATEFFWTHGEDPLRSTRYGSFPGPLCGNGVLDPYEVCDDGNKNNGDGCTQSCAVEPEWYCTGQPSVCRKPCGDGVCNMVSDGENSIDCRQDCTDPTYSFAPSDSTPWIRQAGARGSNPKCIPFLGAMNCVRSLKAHSYGYSVSFRPDTDPSPQKWGYYNKIARYVYPALGGEQLTANYYEAGPPYRWTKRFIRYAGDQTATLSVVERYYPNGTYGMYKDTILDSLAVPFTVVEPPSASRLQFSAFLRSAGATDEHIEVTGTIKDFNQNSEQLSRDDASSGPFKIFPETMGSQNGNFSFRIWKQTPPVSPQNDVVFPYNLAQNPCPIDLMLHDAYRPALQGEMLAYKRVCVTP